MRKNISVDLDKVVLPITEDFITEVVVPILANRIPKQHRTSGATVTQADVCGFDPQTRTMQFSILFEYGKRSANKPLNWVVTGQKKEVADRVQVGPVSDAQASPVPTKTGRKTAADYKNLKTNLGSRG